MDKDQSRSDIRFPIAPEKAPEAPQGEPERSDYVREIFRRPLKMGFEDSAQTGFHSGPISKRNSYQVILWSWTAGAIDVFLCLGISCIFLVFFALLMQSPISLVIKNLGSSLSEVLSYVFLCFIAVYLMVSRSFLGFSLGEWTCQLRLGTPKERLLKDYSVRVVLRTLLIVVTGFVLMPVLSLLFGKDLVGQITGVHIVSLK